jgi:hypothetical protein
MTKYVKGDIIVHRKGGRYVVAYTPDDGFRLEHNNEPAYAYRRVTSAGVVNDTWLRGQSEIEDEARFRHLFLKINIPVTKSPPGQFVFMTLDILGALKQVLDPIHIGTLMGDFVPADDGANLSFMEAPAPV